MHFIVYYQKFPHHYPLYMDTLIHICCTSLYSSKTLYNELKNISCNYIYKFTYVVEWAGLWWLVFTLCYILRFLIFYFTISTNDFMVCKLDGKICIILITVKNQQYFIKLFPNCKSKTLHSEIMVHQSSLKWRLTVWSSYFPKQW